MTPRVTALQVCHSAAGYYIGRLFFDTDLECWMPWSRNSVQYWLSRQDAQAALDSGKFTWRDF